MLLTWVRTNALYVGAILLLLITIAAGIRACTRDDAERERAEANVEAITTASAAAEAAGAERQSDAAIVRTQQEELNDAEKLCALDGEDSDDCRLRRGCIILRQQGTDTARIPACQRLDL